MMNFAVFRELLLPTNKKKKVTELEIPVLMRNTVEEREVQYKQKKHQIEMVHDTAKPRKQ